MNSDTQTAERSGDGSVLETLARGVRANAAVLAIIAMLAVATISTLGVVALTPEHELPVGTAVTYGDSMGHDEPQVILYVDVAPEVGDTIVFDAGEHGYLHHRIIAEESNGYVTQGDTERGPDQFYAGVPWASSENIRGVVIASAPVSAVQGALLALLVLLGLVGAAIYRRQLAAGFRRLKRGLDRRIPGGTAKAVFFVTVVVVSIVAIPFMGGLSPNPDHDGTAAASQDNDVIYTSGAGSDPVRALNASDGSQIWATEISSSSQKSAPEYSSSEDLVIVGNSGSGNTGILVTALHASNGSIAWQNSYSYIPEAISVDDKNGVVYISFGDGTVRQLNTADGTQNWADSFPSADDIALTNSSEHLYVADYSSQELIKYSVTGTRGQEWAVALGYYVWSVDVDSQDNAVVSSNDMDYTVEKYDSTGTNLWTYNGIAAQRHQLKVGPNDEKLMISDYDTNNIYMLNWADGTKAWNNSDTSTAGPAWSKDGSTAYHSTGNGELKALNPSDGTTQFLGPSTGGSTYKTSGPGAYAPDDLPVSGTVTDTAGNAQSGVTVEAKDGTGTVVDSTTTDSSGNYELGVPESATYEITADDGDHSSTKTVDVPSGGKSGVDFEIGPTVTGNVTDGDGNVLENVDVSADDPSVESVKTNATGEYELLFPGSGTYNITADDGDHVSTKTVDVVTGGVTGINFRLGPGIQDGQPVGLIEDDLGVFPADNTELVVHERTTEYKPLWTVPDGESVEDWHSYSWEETERASFNWENRTHVNLVHDRYYRLELDSPHGSWEDSGFRYNDTEMSGSTIWLAPDTGSTDTNGDGTTGGAGSSGTNAWDSGGSSSSSTPTPDSDGNVPTATPQGFGPTALGTCTTLDGQDGVEVEYWDPSYSTAELRANLTVDGSATYHIRKSFDDPRGYYRGCIADVMTDNATKSNDIGLNHSALDAAGNEISSGSKSWSAPVFGPSGKAPASTGERIGLLAGVLGALGVLWVGGNKVVPASSVPSWPSETINPAFGIGAPIVTLLGLDLAGGGVISAGVATGLAQIAPFAGMVAVSVGGYYALRWIRAPPS